MLFFPDFASPLAPGIALRMAMAIGLFAEPLSAGATLEVPDAGSSLAVSCTERLGPLAAYEAGVTFRQALRERGPSFPDLAAFAKALRDRPARLLPANFHDVREGNMNEGVFLYLDAEKGGRPTALKFVTNVMPGPERKRTQRLLEKLFSTSDASLFTEDEIFDLSERLRSYAANLGKARVAGTLGGPKLYEAGLYRRDGTYHLSISMEWIGYGERAMPLKSGSAETVAFAASVYAAHPDWAERASTLLLGPLRQRFVPGDSDFILTESGTLRWLDSGEWVQYSSTRLALRAYPAIFWAAVDKLSVASASPARAEKLVRRFAQDVRAADWLTSAERAELIARLAEKRPAQAAWFRN